MKEVIYNEDNDHIVENKKFLEQTKGKKITFGIDGNFYMIPMEINDEDEIITEDGLIYHVTGRGSMVSCSPYLTSHGFYFYEEGDES